MIQGEGRSQRNDRSFSPKSPFLSKKYLKVEGATIGHYRVSPGTLCHNQHKSHLVVIPFAGAMFWERNKGGGEWMGADQTLIVPAGQRYSSFWKHEIDHLTVFLDPAFVHRMSRDSRRAAPVEIEYSAKRNDPLIRQIGVELAVEIESHPPAGSLYAESLVTALTAHLLRRYSNSNRDFRPSVGGLSKNNLRRALEFIESNLDRDLRLAEIAQEIELSLHHFARAFKQTTGVSPNKFLTQRRIERAKTLLGNFNLSLAEVGLRAGFKNQSHFTTLFRKLTAATPKTYRDEILR